MNIFQIFGLLILLAFYGSYFLKMFLQSRVGIKTNQMGIGTKPKKTIIIEVILKVFTFSTILIEVVSVILDDKLLLIVSNETLRYIGFIVAFIGVSIFIISIITMRDSWRAGVDETQETELIKDGIYKYSRNPAFVGFYLLYIGLVLSFSNIYHIVIVLITIILFHFQILEEEKFLISTFKDEYIDYLNKTPRYFIR